MVQFAPERKPHWGASLGSLLGSGLSGLANSKLQNIQKFNDENLGQQYGLNPEQARALSKADPAVRNDFFKQHEFVNRPSQGQQQPLEQLLQSLSQGQQQPQQMQGQAQQPEQNQLQQALQALSQQQPQQIQQQQISEQQPFGPIRKKDSAAQALEKRHQENMQLKKQEISTAEQDQINKDNYPAFREAKKQYEQAQVLKQLYKDQERMLKTGKLKEPITNSVINALGKFTGIDTSSLKGSTGEAFDKVSAQIVTELAKSLGGRVTNLALSNFMKQVASSSNSPEGAKEILKHANHLAEMLQAPFETMRGMVKDNNNKIPLYMEFDAAEKSAERINKLADEFNDTYQMTETPYGQAKSLGFAGNLDQAKKNALDQGGNAIRLKDGNILRYDSKTGSWS